MTIKAQSPLLYLSGTDLGRVVWIDGLYELLGVDPSASRAEITRAYRELAKQWHPDVRRGDPHSAEQMIRLNEARDVLSCERLRVAYDWLRPFPVLDVR